MSHSSDRPAPLPPLADVADRWLDALGSITGAAALSHLSGAQLLMERAWLSNLAFVSGRSAAGQCRLLPTYDGTMAVSLVRSDDWEVIPAWLEIEARLLDWADLAQALADRPSAALIERARTLGLAAADAEHTRVRARHCTVDGPAMESATRAKRSAPPRVIDLTALWAGPLCTHLLQLAGADVIKVESTNRPDGARSGSAAFYDLLNQGKRCVSLDLAKPAGWRTLRELIRGADIVVEGSRPRALRQMGIEAEALCAERADLTWISITGYGRDEPEANWIAFGDDAGVAAGLSRVMRDATGGFEFAGDAIADPLTGIQAALAAWSSWCCGGSRLISLALAEVAACALAESRAEAGAQGVTRAFGEWWRHANGSEGRTLFVPRAVVDHVAAPGEHTAAVLAEL